MIQYENMSTVAVIFTLTGSVFPRSIPMGSVSFVMGLALAILRVSDNLEAVFGREDYLDLARPVVTPIIATGIGFVLVMRTNMALDRWMSAMSEIEVMVSRWADAFNALNSFFAGKQSSAQEVERIQFFRVRMAHWFSLMSCLAFATLRARDLHSLKDVPMVPKYPLDESRVAKKRKSVQSTCSSEMSRRSSGTMKTVNSQDPRVKSQVQTARDDLSILHAPSAEEMMLLEPASDKVNAVCLWIIQSIMVEVRDKTLDAPPPIVTRVFQELSNGMLGFHQAHKVAMVPFPFPFSQMVAFLLVVLYITFPFFIDTFTKNVILTPVISFVVPTCYCCINHLSIELEDPFAYSFNEIDVEVMNSLFNMLLEDTLWGPLEPPTSANHDLERAVCEGILAERRVGQWSNNDINSSRGSQHQSKNTYLNDSNSQHSSAVTLKD